MSPERIPLFEPTLGGREWDYVKDCLDTGWVSSVGAHVTEFERMMAERIGVRHAVAAVNGTSALHIALLVSGVEPGDEVLLSSLTFIAPANALRYARALPVFMDADPGTWQMDVGKTVAFLEKECRMDGDVLLNRSTGRRVRALMPVDILGHPVDAAPLFAAARRFGLTVLEDASEAVGVLYKGEPAGRRADIACYSFNGNKIVTCGGGGMLVTDDPDLAARAKHLTTQAKADPIEYLHDSVGYNYRLTNVLAAIGRAQLERLDEFVARKRAIAARYEEALESIAGLTPLKEPPDARSTFWMYTVRVDPARFGIDSRALIARLARAGIMARPLWQPLHLSRPHGACQAYRCETAETLYREAVSLPGSVDLTEAQQERVIEELRRA